MFSRHIEPFLLALIRHFPCVADHDCALGLVINNDEKARQLNERIISVPAASL